MSTDALMKTHQIEGVASTSKWSERQGGGRALERVRLVQWLDIALVVAYGALHFLLAAGIRRCDPGPAGNAW